ncbi:hypothetical protein CHU_1419 [Cytophaga hutchinsonii ATCC 33406]|uniref:Uncharacterized protein n=1 Tax=Cytophaga hutchinsonii (strain ATCC 33406 / DSM 1761 / CIP 103989 / NBRC 15051 / NCIMB 9469 / D465) TaxID=269798 RepID=A0A6N4SQS6_CYTH3|nr:hypothetical protein CHU_1419 [Cytophaga hutchinsonii ATCC 33406]
MKDKPAFFKASISLGNEAGPMPCSDRISSCVCAANCFSVFTPIDSNALLAGAPNVDRNTSLGYFAASQTGQAGHSVLL